MISRSASSAARRLPRFRAQRAAAACRAAVPSPSRSSGGQLIQQCHAGGGRGDRLHVAARVPGVEIAGIIAPLITVPGGSRRNQGRTATATQQQYGDGVFRLDPIARDWLWRHRHRAGGTTLCRQWLHPGRRRRYRAAAGDLPRGRRGVGSYSPGEIAVERVFMHRNLTAR